MQLSNGILLFHSTLIVQHVSSFMWLIIRNLNCICSFWFTYVCGDRPSTATSHITMHGSMNIKFINAKQATEIHAYKNIKRKLYKTNAAIWFNKTCRVKQLTPNYINIKINKYIQFFTLLQYVNQKLQIQLRFLMMSDITLETC